MTRVLTILVVLLGALAFTGPAAAHPGDDEPTGAARGAYYDGGNNAFAAQARAVDPVNGLPPRAECGPGSVPEGEMQGRVPPGVTDGFRCNMEVVGKSGSTGGFRVHRYVDKAGRECAYYDTALLFPTNALSLSAEPTGVAVLDMTDSSKPVRTTTLLTPAMQTPHESFNISEQRGLLAAVTGNPTMYPGIVDVYDIKEDCRQPQLQSSVPAAIFGHESGMAPDGKTFYPTSIGSEDTTAVDISNPRLPRRIWEGRYGTHGMSVSDDGNRGYFAAGEGLIIADLSEVQARKPNPQVRVISRLTWPNMTIPQYVVPVTIKGKPYLVEVDEYSSSPDGDGVEANGPRVGAARIIDISDERNPFVVSSIRLQVHQPENRAAIANDPGAQNPTQGYAAHYCNVPQRQEPGIVACSMILSGLRVFDIRDPKNPKEIAYHVAPPNTISATGGPTIDERANWAMSQPAFDPERGEIWYSDGTSGFYALRMTNDVWPFRGGSGGGSGGSGSGPTRCTPSQGFRSAAATPRGRGLRLGFKRRENLPVRVDVFRVSRGRRVMREILVARFRGRRKAFTWNGVPNRGDDRRLGDGLYFVRFTMARDGRRRGARRVVLARRNGRFVRRPGHHQRDACGVLRRFKLSRPAFGGRRQLPLGVSYALGARARVAITITRGRRVVRRYRAADRGFGRTYRVSLPARGLPRGDYRVRITVVRNGRSVTATLVSRRL